jgi:hypothetical protein
MTNCTHSEAAELHTQAAYAHLAADHEIKTGDPCSAQELSKAADEFSIQAAKVSKDIVNQAPSPSIAKILIASQDSSSSKTA